MTTILVPKSSNKFICNLCDYSTCRKSQYERHLYTSKHKNTTNTTNLVPPKSYCYICECGKEYKHHSSLWNHKKKCTCKDKVIGENCQTNDIGEIKEIMKYLIKENSEMKNIILEQQHMMMTQNTSTQNMIMKVIENGTNNNITNNTNSHNKTFNLNFFLNETCKNALNIDDFVSSVKVSLSELENTGRRGYIEGISNIIINKLNKLSQCDRPLHCSDEKRETMYIKNDNQWIKETEEKPILKKAIKTIANENIKQINTWRQQHPDCTDADSNKNNLYLKIVSNSMCGSTKEESEKNYEKIISNVAKQVIIDK
jgi:hypothetical protein